jgi:hypothetical protein
MGQKTDQIHGRMARFQTRMDFHFQTRMDFHFQLRSGVYSPVPPLDIYLHCARLTALKRVSSHACELACTHGAWRMGLVVYAGCPPVCTACRHTCRQLQDLSCDAAGAPRTGAGMAKH